MRLLLYAKAKEIFNSNYIIIDIIYDKKLLDIMNDLCNECDINENNKNYILNICKYALDNKFIETNMMINNDMTIKIIPPISSG